VFTIGCGAETITPMSEVKEFTEAEDIPLPSRNLEQTDMEPDPAPASDPDIDNEEMMPSMPGMTGSDEQDPMDPAPDPMNPPNMMPPPPPPTVNYNLDGTSSLLYAQVLKDRGTLLSGLAHDHVIRPSNWTGSVSYNPNDMGECGLSFTLPVADFVLDETAMRMLVGYGDEIDDDDRATIRENMLSTEQLDVSQFPTIDFMSTGCVGNGGNSGTITISGTLTVRGQTKSVNTDVTFRIQDGELYAQGSFQATHADFGFEPYSAAFGGIRNGEDISITFDVVGTP
jgi:polyisoprenoid-binding protein YceI